MGGKKRNKAQQLLEEASQSDTEDSGSELEAGERQPQWVLWERKCAVQAAAAGRAKAECAFTSRGTIAKQWQALAVRDFAARVVGAGKPEGFTPIQRSDASLKRFIKRSESTFESTGAVYEKPRSGRPRCIPEDVVAATVLSVRQQGLGSQEEYNVQPEFRRIFKQYQCSPATLWRRMHELDPSLSKCVRVEYRRPLADTEVKKRCVVAGQWLNLGLNAAAAGVTTHRLAPGCLTGPVVVAWPPEHKPGTPQYDSDEWLADWAKRVIWIDEKTIHITPDDHNVWGPALEGARSLVRPDARKALSRAWKIKYVSAVNYQLGAVLLEFISGSWAPNYRPQQEWKTLRGKKAKMMTKAEFQAFITKVSDKLPARCAERGVELFEPIWSWDNPRNHGSFERGDWEGGVDIPIYPDQHTGLPSYSGDMHNVIETSHAVVCGALQKFIDASPDTTPFKTYHDKLKRLFYELLTPAWAQATVKRLFSETLPAVLEAGGQYPEKKYR